MVSSRIELKFEKLFRIWAILPQDWLWSRSPLSITGFPVLVCTGIFPVVEKSIQGIEHSWKSCRIRRLRICINVSRYTIRIPYIYLAANLSRGLAILLVHEEEETTLVDWEREIIVHCKQIRHLWNYFRPFFLSKIPRVEIPDLASILPTFEYFKYEYH